jgi:hypothetical protein
MGQTIGTSGSDERGRAAARAADPRRSCGECSLCCIALRVDELGKLAGEPCPKLGPNGGCTIHASRPPVCREYHCHWLEGGLEAGDRPDRIGGIVDFAPGGVALHMAIVEARPGAFDASPRLQAIARAQRDSLDVRVSDTRDVLDPDRPVRVLQAGGRELVLAGDRVRTFEHGRLVSDARLPLIERFVRRLQLRIQRWRLRRLASTRRRVFDREA